MAAAAVGWQVPGGGDGVCGGRPGNGESLSVAVPLKAKLFFRSTAPTHSLPTASQVSPPSALADGAGASTTHPSPRRSPQRPSSPSTDEPPNSSIRPLCRGASDHKRCVAPPTHAISHQAGVFGQTNSHPLVYFPPHKADVAATPPPRYLVPSATV